MLLCIQPNVAPPSVLVLDEHLGGLLELLHLKEHVVEHITCVFKHKL